MAKVLPITLVGDNLGERHMYFNSLVSESFKAREEFDLVKNLPEIRAIDRLFKIKLAIKTRNVAYILQNLKDDDMLYVTKALQAKWLFEPEYKEIINPEYLEEQLYPDMITTAVSKMKHWVHLNLSDASRCKQFYDYYRDRNFKLASKFLVKCTRDDIRHEFKYIILIVTPSYLKKLSEKCPEVTQMFFDSISENNEVKRLYLEKERDYYTILLYLLKTSPDMVLDFTEKYYNKSEFNRFSATQTKFIMKHQRNRFCKKPELYTSWLLDTDALAETLNAEEAKQLVIKMLQATYLHNESWCSYKTLEPFVKRIKPDERASFKKQVFVEKNVGETVEKWPYKLPEPPTNEPEYEAVFTDRQPEPCEYLRMKDQGNKKKILKKIDKKCRNNEIVECCAGKVKTFLDKLFDEFRFASFGQTLYELRNRITAESSPQNREFMMFVLISKTGGHPDAVASLLELLKNHVNEPDNVRAAVIRSLVKRAQIWRLPEISWNQLMQFGQGLGLDGNPSDAKCKEGLHCVFIRELLQNGDCDLELKLSFLSEFSTLQEYSFNQSEEKIISTLLPKILIDLANERDVNTFSVANCLILTIQALEAYNTNLETFPNFIDTVVKFANNPKVEMLYIINHLFDSKVARKRLFPFTANKMSDASYLNVLKHDITKLNPNKFAQYLDNFFKRSDRFLRKLSLYFSEVNGLAYQYLQEFKAKSKQEPKPNPRRIKIKPKKQKVHGLGRAIAYVLYDKFIEYVDRLDTSGDKKFKSLAGAIKANAHFIRPQVNIDEYGWKKCGAKYLGNKFMTCRDKDVDKNVKELLKWKSTARNAFQLSKRACYQNDVFVKLASIRPTIAIKVGLHLLKEQGDAVDPLIWQTIKPLIQKLDIAKLDLCFIVKHLGCIESVPSKIRPDYSAFMYNISLDKSRYDAMAALCHAEILLPDVDEEFTVKLILDFLENDFIVEKLSRDWNDIQCICLYVRILVKYILLCKSENDLKFKIEKYLEPFLTVLEQLRESEEKKFSFKYYFSELLFTLKYSRVFLDTVYISPLPLIERLIVWMRNYFPVGEHFKLYAQIHLLMLFYKSTQQAIKFDPKIFTDPKKKDTDIVKAVGNIFGKFIASEVQQLQTQFFESITEIYVSGIVSFLTKFNFKSHLPVFLFSIIMSLFEINDESIRRLGFYLMVNNQYNLKDDKYTDLINYARNLDDTQSPWFVSYID